MDEYPKGISQLVEEDQKEAKLRKRARGIASLAGKSRDELIVALDCIVEEVHGKVNDVFYTPPPDFSLDTEPKPQMSIQTGQLYYSEIKVTCEDVVRNICFIGWPPLEAGDFIRAYIFRGKDDGVNAVLGPLGLLDNHYVKRRFRASEIAVKLEKIRNGKVVATYGS